jgi:hypothetical protein
LREPRESLLKTTWPALEAEIRDRFDAWRAPREAHVAALAASADSVRTITSPDRGTRLRRLPADVFPAAGVDGAPSAESPVAGMGQLYERHEGGVLSRALGIGVHTLLQEFARLRTTADWQSARDSVARMEPRVTALIRGAGIEQPRAVRTAAQAMEIALDAAQHPTGQWILSPRANAASEVRWTGVVGGRLRTVQIDRAFRAGAEPQTADGDVWWIIDYKTAHEDGADIETALPELRKIFAPQVEAYAQMLRNLHGGDTKICGGLYYPRMLRFDWWEM